MKLFKKIRKGFTLIELVVVIAVIAILAAVSVVSYVAITNKAKESNDHMVIDQINTSLLSSQILEKKATVHEIVERFSEEEGYDVRAIKPELKNARFVYSYENGKFGYWKDDKVAYPADLAKIDFTGSNDLWFFEDEAIAEYKDSYSHYLKAAGTVTSITAKGGIDVGGCTTISSINLTRETKAAKDVVIRTNGGTLTVNAPKDTLRHYGEGQVVTLTAVGTNSYYENGSVEQVNIKKGRLVLTNNENASVETVYLEATGDSYDDIILATQNGAELPELITRDDVPLPTGDNTKKVVTIQTNVNEDGSQPEKTETINLYATKGTSGNDVYEATNGYNVSDLALLVVEASSTEAKAQAAEQISDPEVVEKVTESKAAVEVKSEKELTAALTTKAKYITIIEDFSTTSFINVSNSTSIDGGNHTITCEAGATRVLRVTKNDVSLKLQNIKLVGHSKTERGVQVDSDTTGVTLKLINVEISNISYYGINICNGVDVDLYIDNSIITAWGALNLWSAKYDVVVKNSTLNGINDKTYNKYGWNDFATVVLEGDTTGKTNDHSSVIDVKLINTTITATSTENNKQALIGFNGGATANNVSCEKCTLKLDNSIYTYNYYDHGEGNKMFVDGEQIDIETYYNNYLLNVRGYDVYITYNDGTYLRGANLTLDDALSQSKLYLLQLKKDATLSKDYVLQSASVYNNYIFMYLQGHNLNRNGHTLKVTNNTVVITDSYESLLPLFSTDDGYHIVEDTNGEDGPYVYFAEADE